MALGEFVLLSTVPFTLIYLVIALIPLCLSLYCVASSAPGTLTFLTTAATVVVFFICPYTASTQCPPADIVLRLVCGTAIMKVLDMYFRRHHPPVLNFPASPAKYAFYLLIELRYESFDICTARNQESSLSSGRVYLIHLGIFLTLQLIPQNSIVKAFGVLFAIW